MAGNPLSLKVVSIEDLFPHEHIDPRRVKKLLSKIKKTNLFTNPIMVMKRDRKYIILDGATRFSSFKKLGFNHIITQVISKNNGIALDRWFHVIRQMDKKKLIRRLKKLSEMTMTEMDAGAADINLNDEGKECFLQTVDGKVYQMKINPDVSHIKVLNKITNRYMGDSFISRTTAKNIKRATEEYPDAMGLMVFPEYKIEDVLKVTENNWVFPAGITRFLIPGRVMRLNVDFEYLKSDRSLEDKNKWLDKTVLDKFANNSVRYYKEPVYLLDE